LVAIGKDPNDNYFPIAVATVEAETKDSSGWFLNYERYRSNLCSRLGEKMKQL